MLMPVGCAEPKEGPTSPPIRIERRPVSKMSLWKPCRIEVESA